jgi:hypothetical protein
MSFPYMPGSPEQVRVTRQNQVVYLEQLSTVTDLTYATQWGEAGKGPGGGPWDATWGMPALPANFTHPVLQRGAKVEIICGGEAIWCGNLAEPDRDNWTFSARGIARWGDDYLCIADYGDGPIPSTTPEDVIEYAISLGLRWWITEPFVDSTVYSTPLRANEDQIRSLSSLTALLDAVATANGVRWWVEPDGEVRTGLDQTSPKWRVIQDDAPMGTADDDYYSDLYGRHIATVADGSDPMVPAGTPLTFGTEHVRDDFAFARWGYKAKYIDLTPRGVLTSGAVLTDLNTRLAQAGGRMQFTSGFSPAWFELLAMNGVPVSWWQVRAGDMFEMANVMDQWGNLEVGLSQQVIAGRVEVRAGESISVTPVGFAPRDLLAVLADAVKPERELKA